LVKWKSRSLLKDESPKNWKNSVANFYANRSLLSTVGELTGWLAEVGGTGVPKALPRAQKEQNKKREETQTSGVRRNWLKARTTPLASTEKPATAPPNARQPE
jgi:hypothetical protein